MGGKTCLQVQTAKFILVGYGMRVAELIQNLEMLALALDEKTGKSSSEKGFHLIVDYRNCGGSKQETYDALLPLSIKHQDENENQYDLICDWLDCICGWIGNKKLRVWDE